MSFASADGVISTSLFPINPRPFLKLSPNYFVIIIFFKQKKVVFKISWVCVFILRI